MPFKLALVALLAAAPVSAAAPDFALKDLAGTSVRLSGFRGKVVLLDFWATWCDSCADLIPFVDKLDERYRPLGFVVAAISEDARVKDVARFAAKNRMTRQILLDRGEKAFRAYGVRGLPTAVLVDRGGTIRGRWVGFDATAAAEIEKAVAALLKEGKAAAQR